MELMGKGDQLGQLKRHRADINLEKKVQRRREIKKQ
jgi:hypothetical protein